MSIPIVEESTEQFLSGGGEMGKLIRTMDWSKTALGPIESWPQSLRTSVSLCLSSTFPILIAWGPETIQIYNDSYRPICGAMHPQSMGMNFRICWESALEVVGDKFSRGQQGEGTYIQDQRMFLQRYGYLEEAFMTFSFAPIRDESGGIGGIFHPITETTEKMLSGRRTQVLRDLGAAIVKAKSVQEIGAMTLSQYDAYSLDIPFLLFYKIEEQEAQLLTAPGLDNADNLAPTHINISNSPWPIQELIETGEMLQVTDLESRFGCFICGPYEEAPTTAIMLPVRISGQSGLSGFIVAGVSARRALDQTYLNFYDQLAATYNTAVSNVYAYEQEQKRAEALAAIDRSKTAFFSNVSHEFRTPLTLMLGPLEELLQQQDLEPNVKVNVEATHRNAHRLLKLVNNLLDYSRVEAGRVQAIYQPVNLYEMTVDLASSFRSIIEKAGMELHVDCEPGNDIFYADRQMWEKIVLNLLSNAFKYTLEGSITVSLVQNGKEAVLSVIDTGVGIPEHELPHMFERFHRVENTAGRTHEGTGIGLSLVHELVQLHGGSISVDSLEGRGSTFTIRIPSGKTHLPSQQTIDNKKDVEKSNIIGAFIKEAYSLLEKDEPTSLNNSPAIKLDQTGDKSTRILIVDDNHDMRDYLKRLLEPHFEVETAMNGRIALEKIATRVPDLVLSDVMMPVMDGKALLEAIRLDEKNLRLPVIFLSARAGEEARIDGLEAGADDYLVKPFSAAELLTKVRAQIHISKTRGHAEQQLRMVLKQAPVAMAIYRGPHHVIETANERMLHYWGRNEQDVLGKPLFKAIPELISQGINQVMDTVYLKGESFVSGEVPLVLNRFGSPETIYILLTIEALREVDQRITGVIAVAADVTEQVKARKSLEKVNNTFQLAIEAAKMGIWQTDLSTGELHISKNARQIHGIPMDQELSYVEALEQLVVPEHLERMRLGIDHAVANKQRFNENYQIQPLDGSPRRWINTMGMIELNEDGEQTSVIGTILDITERKEDEIRKNDFIGMVSHELKTPLTSLIAYNQLGLRSSKKNKDVSNAQIYEKAGIQLQKMSALINGFLNVSQLESGKIVLFKLTFSIDKLIEEIIADIGITNPEQRFELNCDAVEVYADRHKISTVITNLLSNAVKYGAREKPISVRCYRLENYIRVSVKDEGAGIRISEQNKLFDRYYRVENAQTQHISGFGIGLYLSAEIIRRHEGKIWLKSDHGQGSTFFFEIPM